MVDAEIVATEDMVGGKHRIQATRIRVIDIVESYQELGWDIEKIRFEFDLQP